MPLFLFNLLVMAVHALPTSTLSLLGQVSDVMSDMAPEFMRGTLHVLFTILLN